MQIKNNQSNHLHKVLLFVSKIILFVGGCTFLASKLSENPIDFRSIQLSGELGFTLIIVSLLMIINWYLEVVRWEVSVSTFEPISKAEAWRIVLSGLALNWVFPFTTGDLLSRISQSYNKFSATSATILNRGIMLSFTLILGLYGMSKLAVEYDVNGWFGLVIIFGIPLIRKFFKKPLGLFLDFFRNLKRSTLIQIIAISLVRYMVFTFQFYLCLKLFLPELSGDLLLGGIGWIFLVRSALPLFIGGVGVREASGILYFEPYAQIEMIVIPIFLIWFINIVIPSIIGLFFILKLRMGDER